MFSHDSTTIHPLDELVTDEQRQRAGIRFGQRLLEAILDPSISEIDDLLEPYPQRTVGARAMIGAAI